MNLVSFTLLVDSPASQFNGTAFVHVLAAALPNVTDADVAISVSTVGVPDPIGVQSTLPELGRRHLSHASSSMEHLLIAVLVALSTAASTGAVVSASASTLFLNPIPAAATLGVSSLVVVASPMSLRVLPSELSTATLTSLPSTAYQTLPASVLATLPPSALASLPASVLATLPTSALAALPLEIRQELHVSLLRGRLGGQLLQPSVIEWPLVDALELSAVSSTVAAAVAVAVASSVVSTVGGAVVSAISSAASGGGAAAGSSSSSSSDASGRAVLLIMGVQRLALRGGETGSDQGTNAGMGAALGRALTPFLGASGVWDAIVGGSESLDTPAMPRRQLGEEDTEPANLPLAISALLDLSLTGALVLLGVLLLHGLARCIWSAWIRWAVAKCVSDTAGQQTPAFHSGDVEDVEDVAVVAAGFLEWFLEWLRVGQRHRRFFIPWPRALVGWKPELAVFVFFLPGLSNACFAVWTLAVRSESSSTPIPYPNMDAFIAYASVVLALMLLIVGVLTHQLLHLYHAFSSTIWKGTQRLDDTSAVEDPLCRALSYVALRCGCMRAPIDRSYGACSAPAAPIEPARSERLLARRGTCPGPCTKGSSPCTKGSSPPDSASGRRLTHLFLEDCFLGNRATRSNETAQPLIDASDALEAWSSFLDRVDAPDRSCAAIVALLVQLITAAILASSSPTAIGPSQLFPLLVLELAYGAWILIRRPAADRLGCWIDGMSQLSEAISSLTLLIACFAPGTVPLLSQVSAYSLLAGTVALPALLTYYDNGLQYIEFAATARSRAARLYQRLCGRTSSLPHPASQVSTPPLARPPPPPPRRKLPFAAAAAAAAFLRSGPHKSRRWRGFGARPLPRPTAAWDRQVKV